MDMLQQDFGYIMPSGYTQHLNVPRDGQIIPSPTLDSPPPYAAAEQYRGYREGVVSPETPSPGHVPNTWSASTSTTARYSPYHKNGTGKQKTCNRNVDKLPNQRGRCADNVTAKQTRAHAQWGDYRGHVNSHSSVMTHPGSGYQNDSDYCWYSAKYYANTTHVIQHNAHRMQQHTGQVSDMHCNCGYCTGNNTQNVDSPNARGGYWVNPTMGYAPPFGNSPPLDYAAPLDYAQPMVAYPNYTEQPAGVRNQNSSTNTSSDSSHTQQFINETTGGDSTHSRNSIIKGANQTHVDNHYNTHESPAAEQKQAHTTGSHSCYATTDPGCSEAAKNAAVNLGLLSHGTPEYCCAPVTNNNNQTNAQNQCSPTGTCIPPAPSVDSPRHALPDDKDIVKQNVHQTSVKADTTQCHESAERNSTETMHETSEMVKIKCEDSLEDRDRSYNGEPQMEAELIADLRAMMTELDDCQLTEDDLVSLRRRGIILTSALCQ